MNELGALGNDISGGVRASARLVSTAEAGVRQGAELVGASLVPALAKRETQVRGELLYQTAGITRAVHVLSDV